MRKIACRGGCGRDLRNAGSAHEVECVIKKLDTIRRIIERRSTDAEPFSFVGRYHEIQTLFSEHKTHD